MKNQTDSRIIQRILANIQEQRKLIMLLSCLVVFTTTYLLILPAFTLDKEEAAEQGGIDMPAADAAEETSAEESASGDSGAHTERGSRLESGAASGAESEYATETAMEAAPEAEASAEDLAVETAEDSEEETEGAPESPLVYEGDGYTVTASFGEDAELPAGTELMVSEIRSGTEAYYQDLGQVWEELNREYIEVEEQRKSYNEGMGFLPETNLMNLDDARFFDVQLVSDGQAVEPSASVQIDISLDDGMELKKGAVTEVAYVDKDGADIISDSEIEGSKSVATGFSFEQAASADIGIFTGHETSDQGRTETKAAARKVMKANAAKAAGNDELPKPYADKTLEPNQNPDGTDDGTYTLTLNVGGTTKQNTYSDVNKSNVLIVMDRSSSMTSNNTYDKYTGVHQSNTSYYGVLNGTISDDNKVELTYMNNRYYYQSGYWMTEYNGTVYTRRTRLEAEQDALASLIRELTNKNRPGETVTDEDGNTTSLDDIIEVKVISFASGRTDVDKANGFRRNGYTVDTKGTTFSNTESGWGTTYTNGSTLKSAIDDSSVAKGTNWEEAMEYAKEVADQKKAEQPDEPVFVVFLTDGEPTDIHGDNGNAQHYQDNEGCLRAAEPDAKAIVDAHSITTAAGETVMSDHRLYGIFTYGDTDAMKSYLRRLVNYAYGKGDEDTAGVSGGTADYYFDADSTGALLNAFQHILSQVTSTMAYGKVKVVDGLTTDAMTTTLVHGSAEGYKYTVSGPVGELYSVRAEEPESGHGDPTVTFTINGQGYPGVKKSAVIDGRTCEYWSYTSGTGESAVEYKMALADLSGDGMLTWDLSGIGTLLDGYTYSVSFVVWPDQDAYDYVAALNNGLPGCTWDTNASTYEDLTSTKGYAKGGVKEFPSIVRYPNGVFAVLTNTEQKVEYSIVETKEEDGTTTTSYKGPYEAELPAPEPMPLKASDSSIEKVWNVERDPGILAQMLYELGEDGSELGSKEVNITFDIMQDSSAKKYTDVTLGWDEDKQKYIWEEGSEQTVTYKGHDCEVGTRWAADFSIATGLMLSEARMIALGMDKSLYPSGTFGGTKYYILETGHDYRIKEPGLTFEFDFESPVYHPMLVDGVLQSVNFTIDGKQAEITAMTDEESGLPSLRVQNTLRGYINLNKVVVDTDGTTVIPGDETEFTYTVELDNDTVPGPFTVEGDHVPWYGINGLYYHDEDGNYYQAEPNGTGRVSLTDEDGDHYDASCSGVFREVAGPQTVTLPDGTGLQLYGNQMDHDSDNHVHTQISISQNQTLNIANVPVGTTYTITESEQAGYTPVRIVREIKLDENDSDPEKSETFDGAYEISGTIVSNRDNQVTYYNKSEVTDINIRKLDESGKGLAGAVFELKKVTDTEGRTEVYASELGVRGLGDITKETEGGSFEYHSAFETTGEAQRISGLQDGTYRLREVYVPAGYVCEFKYIEFTVENRVVSNVKTDSAASFEDTGFLDFTAADGSSLALLSVTNEAGTELPHTGGIGTTIFYILGSLLVAGCGVVLIARRRMGKASK